MLAAARSGSRLALETLLRRHYDSCYAICRRLLGNEQDALDATQETMIAIARGLGRFDGRSALSTWVYRIATNTSLDELRRRRRHLPSVDHSRLSEDDTDLGAFVASRTKRDDVGESVAARIALGAALEQLAEDQRAAVILRDMLDIEYAEIAAVLGVPIGTVRSRIARGRAALARSLAGPEGSSEIRPS